MTNINIIEKDILLATDAVIGHCCNTQNTMNSGVAKALRVRFPEVYEADSRSYILNGKELLGKSIWVPVITSIGTTNIRQVVNMYGQPNYGYDGSRFVNYEAIYQCLENLVRDLKAQNYTSVGLPYKIASDRAGGWWPIIEEMIKHIFDDTDVTVNLYKL